MSLSDEEYQALRQQYEQLQVLEQERMAREVADLAAREAENARQEEEFARKWREQQAEEQLQWKVKLAENEERIRQWQANPWAYADHFYGKEW